MAEQKKVAFSTISSENGNTKRKKTVRTIRLALALSESNEKSCPEFNYRDLLSQRIYLKRKEKAKKVDGQILNGPLRDADDPLASDDDEALKTLARQLEKKYGAPGKRRKRDDRDFKTLGEGYDETDPFIDNSDAVDDAVPINKETKHRGFYINSGELDFDEVPVSQGEEESAHEESIDNSLHIKKKRKNLISSDEEETAAPVSKEIKKVPNVHPRENGILLKHKKRKLDEGELLRRRKKLIYKFNTKKQPKKIDKENGESEPKKEEPEGEENQEEEEEEEVRETKPAEQCKEFSSKEKSIADSIEAVINMAMETVPKPLPTADQRNHVSPSSADQEGKEEEIRATPDEDSSSNSSSSNSSSSTSQSSSNPSVSEKENDKDADGPDSHAQVENASEAPPERMSVSDAEQEVVPLPSNLSPDLKKVIDLLKEAGHLSKSSSQKFFTESVNKMLLSIELKVSKVGGGKKTQIYNHLSQHLPCGTQTLIKRGKCLLNDSFEANIEQPIEKLRQTVNDRMPSLIEKHAKECQKAAEKKGEGDQNDEENEDPSKKAKRLPKKRFHFDEKTRQLLYEAVQVRCQLYSLVKKRSETGEAQIRNFLESRVKPIWPKGWMTTKVLFKESAEIHNCITGYPFAKKEYDPKQNQVVMASGVVENKHIKKSDIPPSQNTKVNRDNVIVSNESVNLIHDSSTKRVEPDTSKGKDISIKSQSTAKPPPCTSPKHSPLVNSEAPAASQITNSPTYDSSPASFIGFESPSKTLEGSANHAIDLKLNPSLDFNKKSRPKSPQYDTSIPVREGKPPRPSLSATVHPKVVTNVEEAMNASEPIKKSPLNDDKKASNSISIKTVERINEGAQRVLFKKDSKDVVHDPQDKKEVSLVPSKKVDTSGAIDLSSDVKRNDPVVTDQNVSIDLSNKGQHGDVCDPNEINSAHPEVVVQRDEKLEQEMDDVMNELLQISKKKKQQGIEPPMSEEPKTPSRNYNPETFHITPCDSLNAKLDSFSLKPQLKLSSVHPHPKSEAGPRLPMNPPMAHLHRNHSQSTSALLEDASPRLQMQHSIPKPVVDIEPVSVNKNSAYQQANQHGHSNGLSESSPNRLSASIFPVSRPSCSINKTNSPQSATIHTSPIGMQKLSPQKTPPSPHRAPSTASQPPHGSQVSIHRISPKNLNPSSYPSPNQSHDGSHASVSIFSTSHASSSSLNSIQHTNKPSRPSPHSIQSLSQSSHATHIPSDSLKGIPTSFDSSFISKSSISHSSPRSTSHTSYGNSSQSASTNYSQSSRMNKSPSSHQLPSHAPAHGYPSHNTSVSGQSRSSCANHDALHRVKGGSHSLESHGLQRNFNLEVSRAVPLPYDSHHSSSRGLNSSIESSHSSARGASHLSESSHRPSSHGSSKVNLSTKLSSSSVADSNHHGSSYDSGNSYNVGSGGISHKSMKNGMGRHPLPRPAEYSHHQQPSTSPQKIQPPQVSPQLVPHHQKLLHSGSSWPPDATAIVRGSSSSCDSGISAKTSPSKLQPTPENSYSIGNADLRVMQGMSGNSSSKKQHTTAHLHGLPSPTPTHGSLSVPLIGQSSQQRSSGSAPPLQSPGTSAAKIKQGSDRVSPHALYENLTKEQLEYFKTSQQHPELWSQMNVNNYLSQLPSTEVYKYMSQSGRMYPHGQAPPSNSSGSSKKY